jgi:glycosyltransferase involved in cell wall biosynthesis
MRIAIDIAPLKNPFTGVANFELFLLDALFHEEPSLAIHGFGAFNWTVINRRFLHQCAASAQKMLEGDLSFPSSHEQADTGALGSALWNNVRTLNGAQYLLKVARRITFKCGSVLGGFSLFHAFNYCPPEPTEIPVIPIVYDLSVLRYPETHPTARVRGMEQLARYIAAAPIVHTISEFTASEITEVFGVERSRIVVTYPGVAPIFRFQRDPSPEILGHFGLILGGYALTVATLEPRKNLRTLVAAFSRLPADLRLKMPLCVVGGRGWGDIALPAESRQLQLDGSLRFLGYASDTQLRDLYAGARIMLYPSLYEGFGMPVIEAMACGTPVAASATSSLPEAVGKMGRLIDPLDVDAWTAELVRAATDMNSRDDHACAARRAFALSFTWRRAAKETIQMYQKIAK